MIKIVFISLRSIELVLPTRLIFLVVGEVLCNGFNLVVSSPNDRKVSEAHICIIAIKDKKVRTIHIDWIYPSTSCHLT